MTIEEAITLFGGAATELVCALAKPENNTTQLQRCINAYDMAISALRAQQELESSLKALESNEPLTVDELREMDGEPVYIHSDIFPGDCGWRVVKRLVYWIYNLPMAIVSFLHSMESPGLHTAASRRRNERENKEKETRKATRSNLRRHPGGEKGQNESHR